MILDVDFTEQNEVINASYDEVVRVKDTANIKAVLYTEQNLTEVQKAQARANIGVDEKEEWFEIADITTTEESNSFLLTKDMSGNAFECKRIVAKMILPSALTDATIVYFGNCTSLWSAGGLGVGQALTALHRQYDISVVLGKFLDIKSSYSDSNYAQIATAHTLRCNANDTLVLTKFFIARERGNFPVGTILKVWGKKA